MLKRTWRLRAALLCGLLLAALPARGEPLRVVATIPDLGSLAESIGGEDVAVTTLVKGPQDAHFLEPRPSFVRALHEADVLILTGMELEVGWVPPLLQQRAEPAHPARGARLPGRLRRDRADGGARRAS